METKKRKILKRVGAAFMLGLTLFGLGSQVAKGQENLMPKKTRNIRKDDAVGLVEENQELLSIVEAEAVEAIDEQEMEQAEQKQQQAEGFSRFNRQQTILRYAVLTIWILAAGFFFTSLLFNVPFKMGKAVLSFLPGNPHLAKMFLTGEQLVGDKELKIFIKVDSDGDPVHLVKSAIKYNQEELYFKKYEMAEGKVSKADLSPNNENSEVVFLFETKKGEVWDGQEIAVLYFETKKEKGAIEVEINGNNSLILSRKKDQTENILGQAKDVNLILR